MLNINFNKLTTPNSNNKTKPKDIFFLGKKEKKSIRGKDMLQPRTHCHSCALISPYFPVFLRNFIDLLGKVKKRL
jgi:hypothetical protein